MESNIIKVTRKNVGEHPGVICFINPKHESYHHKIDWLSEQSTNGLAINLLYLEGVKSPVGFIEYIPGKYCRRAVDAKGYLFIHCLWTNGKKYQHQGLGKQLIESVEKEAKGMYGVAVVTSDSSFMANRNIFLQNGYLLTAESGKEQLLVKTFKKSPMPSIHPWEEELRAYHDRGPTIVYSKQCPWVARFIDEVKPILTEVDVEPTFIELTTPSEVQHGPSLYGAFAFINKGKLLADRYISTTRFKNIVAKTG